MYIQVFYQAVSYVGRTKTKIDEQNDKRNGKTSKIDPGFGRLRKAEDSVHELVVVDLDPSIAVGIELPKALAKLLNNNASADKSVKGDTRRRGTTCGRLVRFFVRGV